MSAAAALLERVLPHARAELDVTGAIGKRYRRADEAGTPLCATVDHQTAVDGTVTVRGRDSMRQVRWHADALVAWAAARWGRGGDAQADIVASPSAVAGLDVPE